MSELTSGSFALSPSALALLIAAGSLFIMVLINRFMLSRLIRLTDGTRYHLDSLLVRSLNFPVTLVLVVVNLTLLKHLFDYFEVPTATLASLSGLAQKGLLILALVIFSDRFCSGTIHRYAQHRRFGEEGITIPYPIRAVNLDQESAHHYLRREPSAPDNGLQPPDSPWGNS